MRILPLYRQADVKAIYLEWLKGSSLRTLGKKYGVSRSTMHSWFRRYYGANATNRKYTALAKSILADYPDQHLEEVALNTLGKEGSYYSRHSIEMLTEYQCLSNPIVLDIIVNTPQYDEPDTYLNYHFFMYFVRIIAHLMTECYFNYALEGAYETA